MQIRRFAVVVTLRRLPVLLLPAQVRLLINGKAAPQTVLPVSVISAELLRPLMIHLQALLQQHIIVVLRLSHLMEFPVQQQAIV